MTKCLDTVPIIKQVPCDLFYAERVPSSIAHLFLLPTPSPPSPPKDEQLDDQNPITAPDRTPPPAPTCPPHAQAFATRARVVHIDIDPAEIHKNKAAHIPICSGEEGGVGSPPG